MIDLNRHKTTIADFLNTSIKRFHREYNKPKSINSIMAHDYSLGDERLNLLVFGYLKEIILEIKPNWGMDFLLQMLDSNLVEEI